MRRMSLIVAAASASLLGFAGWAYAALYGDQPSWTWVQLDNAITAVSNPIARADLNSAKSLMMLAQMNDDYVQFAAASDFFDDEVYRLNEVTLQLTQAESDEVWTTAVFVQADLPMIAGSGKTGYAPPTESSGQKCKDRKKDECEPSDNRCIHKTKGKVKPGATQDPDNPGFYKESDLEDVKKFCETT